MARVDLSRRPAPDIKTPPETGGVVVAEAREGGRRLRLGGLLLLEHLRLAAADLDLARLRFLGHLVNEVDMQHAIVEAGADDLDVVGEAEAPFECAAGDAPMQITALVLVGFAPCRSPAENSRAR